MGRIDRSIVSTGLIKRGNVWHIRKWVGTKELRESTGTGNLTEAERYLAHRLEEMRNAEIYGIRPRRTFREAAEKYLNEAEKASLGGDMDQIRLLNPFIGDLYLECVHMGSLQPFIAHRKAQGVRNRTVNFALQVVRHILNLAAGEWLDEHGLTWLQHAPRIKLLREVDKTEPYPLSWEEQERLFAALPRYLRQMALFKVNTGTRDREVCSLRWERYNAAK